MNILFLGNSFGVGGYEQLMLEVFRGMSANGIQVDACFLKDGGKLAPELEKCGVPVKSGFLRGKYDVAAPGRIVREYRGKRFDALFVETGRNALLAGEYIAGRLRIGRRITSVHSTGKWGGGKLFRRSQLFLLRRLDGIIACAETQRRYLVRDEGLPEPLLKTIFNGVDHRKFKPRPKVDLPPFPEGGASARRIAIVASLTPEKGHEVFIEAAGITRKRFPDSRYFIIGDGPERERLKERIGAAGLRESVVLLGIRRDLPELLPHFDLLALSSHPFRETLPISTMEGMACGLPTVNTDVGSARDLVLDGETGYLVPPGNPVALSEAFSRILGDSEHAASLGRAARSRIEDLFTLDRSVADYTDYFRRQTSKE